MSDRRFREEWLSDAGVIIYSKIIAPVAVLPEGRRWEVSCGFPSRRALSNVRRATGECWDFKACDGNTHQIFISPLLKEPVDGKGHGVLPDLAHELVHTVTWGEGHKGEFRRVAKAIGLTGKMTATVAGGELCEQLAAIAKQLGPYPHGGLISGNFRKAQSTRMIKVMAVKCTQCQYVARTTRVWLNEFGPPRCPHGSVMVEVS